MAKKKIKHKGILEDIKNYQTNFDNSDIFCTILRNFLGIYSPDFTTDNLNKATLLRDTIYILTKSYFPNSILTKSLGADMIKDSSKHFSKPDTSLTGFGKRADFSVVSSKSNHVLLSLEAKSNKKKYLSDFIKLCRELKDSIKGIHADSYFGVPVCGILMKGNVCDVYVMDHKHNGLYRIVLLKKFYIPQDYYDMNQLFSIFPIFDKLKEIVDLSAKILRNRPTTDGRRYCLNTYTNHYTYIQT